MNVKAHRSFAVLLILSIITFGIYPLFFWYSYIKDVNTVCAGDGKHTRGLLGLILLSIITLGIYSLVWEYGTQNRLRDNSSRYNAGNIASGGNVLCWQIFGVLLFGLGPFIALYKQVDSLNRITYNYVSGMNKSIQSNFNN